MLYTPPYPAPQHFPKTYFPGGLGQAIDRLTNSGLNFKPVRTPMRSNQLTHSAFMAKPHSHPLAPITYRWVPFCLKYSLAPRSVCNYRRQGCKLFICNLHQDKPQNQRTRGTEENLNKSLFSKNTQWTGRW